MFCWKIAHPKACSHKVFLMEEVFACNACIVITLWCSHIRREKPAAHNVIPTIVLVLYPLCTKKFRPLYHQYFVSNHWERNTAFFIASFMQIFFQCRLYYQKQFVSCFYYDIFSRTFCGGIGIILKIFLV